MDAVVLSQRSIALSSAIRFYTTCFPSSHAGRDEGVGPINDFRGRLMPSDSRVFPLPVPVRTRFLSLTRFFRIGCLLPSRSPFGAQYLYSIEECVFREKATFSRKINENAHARQRTTHWYHPKTTGQSQFSGDTPFSVGCCPHPACSLLRPGSQFAGVQHEHGNPTNSVGAGSHSRRYRLVLRSDDFIHGGRRHEKLQGNPQLDSWSWLPDQYESTPGSSPDDWTGS